MAPRLALGYEFAGLVQLTEARIMGRLLLVFLAFGASCMAPASAWSNDTQRAPLINGVARFWGLGFNAGYHARYPSQTTTATKRLPMRTPTVSSQPASSNWLRQLMQPEPELSAKVAAQPNDDLLADPSPSDRNRASQK